MASASKKGLEVRFVAVGEDLRISPESIASQTDKNTRLVAVSAVRFNSGFRADLKTLSDIAHSCDALFVVDGIQGAGVVPLNVESEGIDILCSAGFKWLLGLPGTGFLYVNPKAQERITPVSPGMFAADNFSKELSYYPDARRFETGTIAYSLFHGWTAGLDFISEIGIDAIYKRVLTLTDRLIQGLKQTGIRILTPIDHLAERSAILVFTMGSPEANQSLFQQLQALNIVVTLRNGLLRISPAFYNTEGEIDNFLNVVAIHKANRI